MVGVIPRGTPPTRVLGQVWSRRFDMRVEMFAQQVEDIHGRLSELYRGANASVQEEANLLLPVAFKELGTASEALQIATKQLFQQTEELAATRALVEAQRQRYQDLF